MAAMRWRMKNWTARGRVPRRPSTVPPPASSTTKTSWKTTDRNVNDEVKYVQFARDSNVWIFSNADATFVPWDREAPNRLFKEVCWISDQVSN